MLCLSLALRVRRSHPFAPTLTDISLPMDSFNDKFANKPVLQMKNIVEVLRSLPAMPQPEVYGGGMQHNHHPHA